MNSDAPLYQRDPEAWHALLQQGNATQPRKRVSADVILHDRARNILLVDPKYKPDWDLPGGMAEANEPPHQAAQRELTEELGLELPVGNLLCIDWVSPHGPWDDLLAFIFDGGVLDDSQVADLTLVDGELAGFKFCTEKQAQERLHPRVWRRAAAAIEALKTGNVQYLQDGNTP